MKCELSESGGSGLDDSAQARALLQGGQLDVALQTAKQAFEQQRTQELQQVRGATHFLHKWCVVANMCSSVLARVSLVF